MAVSTPKEFMEGVLPARLNEDPGKLEGFDISIQFYISGDDGGNWILAIKDNQAAVTLGEVENPTITIKIKDSNYVKLVNGELSGPKAFMSGKLKFKGDMKSAIKLQKLGII